MIRHVPNILTFLRLGLLPIVVGLFYVPGEGAIWTCLGLYIVGALTDFFDGWVARRYEVTSDLGRFLDPIADKIFVVSILVMLVATDRVEGAWTLCILIILIREFLVAGLREFLAPKGHSLPVTSLAKWKTAVQMGALAMLVISPIPWIGEVPGLVLLSIATLLTIITGWIYLRGSFKAILSP